MKHLLLILLTMIPVIGMAQTQKGDIVPEKPYTILVLLNATPQWLTLTREERSAFFEESVMPIFQKIGESVQVGFYDSEYFHSSVSDFMIISTSKLDEYKYLIESLRDTKIYSVPFFEVKDIIVGQQDLFEDFNEKFKKEKG